MPSYNDTKVSYFPSADAGYVGMIFVDATKATLGADETKIAYIKNNVETGLNKYGNVYIDGAKTPITTTDDGAEAMAGVKSTLPRLYKLSYNTDKNVVDIDEANYETLVNLVGCKDTVINNAGKAIDLDKEPASSIRSKQTAI
jgi:hypothetical protein